MIEYHCQMIILPYSIGVRFRRLSKAGQTFRKVREFYQKKMATSAVGDIGAETSDIYNDASSSKGGNIDSESDTKLTIFGCSGGFSSDENELGDSDTSRVLEDSNTNQTSPESSNTDSASPVQKKKKEEEFQIVFSITLEPSTVF